jgi:hypothetical protein
MYGKGETWMPTTFQNRQMIASVNHGPVSIPLLRRFQAGAIKSSETAPKFKRIFENIAVDLFAQFLRFVIANTLAVFCLRSITFSSALSSLA